MWAVLPLLCAGAWLLGPPACGASNLAVSSFGTGMGRGGRPGPRGGAPGKGPGRSETREDLGRLGPWAGEEPGSAFPRPEAQGLLLVGNRDAGGVTGMTGSGARRGRRSGGRASGVTGGAGG